MIVSRIYTAVYGFICVNGWRGPWAIFDIYGGTPHVPTLIGITVVGSVVLVFCKGLRNISSTPFGVSTDHSKGYFVAPTMFKSSVREKSAKIYELERYFVLCNNHWILEFKGKNYWSDCDNINRKMSKFLAFISRHRMSPDFISLIVHFRWLWSVLWWYWCGEVCGFYSTYLFSRVIHHYLPGILWWVGAKHIFPYIFCIRRELKMISSICLYDCQIFIYMAFKTFLRICFSIITNPDRY